MSQIIVTGAAGFIGSHLCEALLERGHHLVGIDNFDNFYDPRVKRQNIESFANHPSFRLIECDIRDPERMRSLVSRDLDAVIHLAARAGVRPSIEQPLLYQDVNVAGTLSLLDACRHHPSCKFIFGSSSSVYGNSSRTPFSEDDKPDEPISPYAATKRAGELLCYTYHSLYRIPITCLRFFTAYGPRQRPDLAIHRFVCLMEAGESIPVFGDGSMRRDYTYIDDIVDGVLRALDHCDGYRIYNLGRSDPIRLSDLVTKIEQAMGRKAKIDRRPQPPGDVDVTYANTSRAERELGYCPKVSIDEGLARFVRWFREQRACGDR